MASTLNLYVPIKYDGPLSLVISITSLFPAKYELTLFVLLVAYFNVLSPTIVINEIIKSYRNAGEEERLFFFRDSNGCEVDLLIREDNVLYPLEIKKTYSPNLQDAKHFARFANIVQGVEVGDGGVICNYDKCVLLGDGIRIIPLSYI